MISVSDSLLSLGSPPLVRVKSINGLAIELDFRITPARAGKIHKSALTLTTFQDHPRSCG